MPQSFGPSRSPLGQAAARSAQPTGGVGLLAALGREAASLHQLRGAAFARTRALAGITTARQRHALKARRGLPIAHRIALPLAPTRARAAAAQRSTTR
jgi:hypothetical protein